MGVLMGRKKGKTDKDFPIDLGVKCTGLKERPIIVCMTCKKDICRGCTIWEHEDDDKRNV